MFRNIIAFFLGISFLVTPSFVLAANIALLPTSTTIAGSAVTVDVYVTGNNVPINAISGTISYPTDKLSVASVSKTGSIISMWAEEPSFSNTGGTVRFEGVILNPGFSGAQGKVLSIRFVRKAGATGAATVRVSSGSVLANDGNATSVTGSLGITTLQIASEATPPVPSTTVALTTPEIISLTHPDQNAWYSSTEPTFAWNLPGGVTAVRTSYGTNPESIPTVVYTPPIRTKSLTDIGDGVYYFSTQFRTGNASWGQVSRYKFQVDTKAPEPFSLSVNDQTVSFSTTDALSGIDRYEVLVDKEAPVILRDTDTYTISGRAEGTYPVIVRAFDRAGNMSEAQGVVTVPVAQENNMVQTPHFQGKTSFISFTAMETLYILLGALIVVTGLLVWFAVVRFAILKGRIKRNLSSIDETVRDDFESIRDHFAVHRGAKTVTKTSIGRMFKTSKANLDLIERDIRHKIDIIKKEL